MCVIVGSMAQVFKGLKNDVQQVAVKVLRQTDAHQLAEFAKVQLIEPVSILVCCHTCSQQLSRDNHRQAPTCAACHGSATLTLEDLFAGDSAATQTQL